MTMRRCHDLHRQRPASAGQLHELRAISANSAQNSATREAPEASVNSVAVAARPGEQRQHREAGDENQRRQQEPFIHPRRSGAAEWGAPTLITLGRQRWATKLATKLATKAGRQALRKRAWIAMD